MKHVRSVSGLVAIIVVLLVGGALLLFMRAGSDVNLPYEMGKALISLAATLLVAGVLSVAIAHRAREELRNEALASEAASALQDLKSAYEMVSQARFRLLSHPTALTFTREIDTVARVRAILQRVERDQALSSTERPAVQEMLDFFDPLARYYQSNFSELLVQSLREQHQRDEIAAGTRDNLDVPALVSTGPTAQAGGGADELSIFVSPHQQWIREGFHRNYKAVSDGLKVRAGLVPPSSSSHARSTDRSSTVKGSSLA